MTMKADETGGEGLDQHLDRAGSEPPIVVGMMVDPEVQASRENHHPRSPTDPMGLSSNAYRIPSVLHRFQDEHRSRRAIRDRELDTIRDEINSRARTRVQAKIGNVPE